MFLLYLLLFLCSPPPLACRLAAGQAAGKGRKKKLEKKNLTMNSYSTGWLL